VWEKIRNWGISLDKTKIQGLECPVKKYLKVLEFFLL
jgi:hypothetical protein